MTLRLMCVAILVIAAHLALTNAAVRVWGLQGFNLKGDPIGHPDPYVKVWCDSTFGGMTEFQQNNANPIWTAEFNFPNCAAKDILKLEVWDKDTHYDDLLETCYAHVQSGTHANECTVGKGSLRYSYELI
ncbi:perforin-1-like [Pygocentrus nattereri]|uniref:perforin-1-like n=1 Tax=Pygocentrus nattereri TaxID=42514 RepID=UPI0018911D49|nr:perforin-1-like [Pygocentrus nattereri]